MKHSRISSFIKTPPYLIKEYLHRRPVRGYRSGFVNGEDRSRAASAIDAMRREGIVILPNYFSADKLREFRSAFTRATEERPNAYTPDSAYNDDIMSVDPVFADAALDPFLLEIVGGYFRRPFGLAIAAATSLRPTPPVRQSSYRWHHDARGRQVNLMIFLSDVTPRGQRMSYLRGSHDRYYGYYRGVAHPMFDDEMLGALNDSVMEVVGPAGSVALFDSNGLHSGNRNDVEGRDTLNINYVTSKRHFKKVSYRKSDLSTLTPNRREVVTANPRLQVVD
jgi:ectoine hydroxylase-related dioxygenase (phytanoyl-CoA dioxygenase family)